MRQVPSRTMLALGVDHHLPPGPQTDMQGETSAYMIGKVLSLRRKGRSSTPELLQAPAVSRDEQGAGSGPARKLGPGKFIGVGVPSCHRGPG